MRLVTTVHELSVNPPGVRTRRSVLGVPLPSTFTAVTSGYGPGGYARRLAPLAKGPQVRAAGRGLVTAYLVAEMLEEADRLIRVRPDLAWTYLEHHARALRAVSLAMREIEPHDEHSDVRDELGAVSDELGEVLDAVEQLWRAVPAQ